MHSTGGKKFYPTLKAKKENTPFIQKWQSPKNLFGNILDSKMSGNFNGDYLLGLKS